MHAFTYGFFCHRYAPIAEGCAIVFSNHAYHRLTAVYNSGESMPGVRKIIAFFLCDGAHPLPTTEDIPVCNWRFKLPFILSYFMRVCNPKTNGRASRSKMFIQCDWLFEIIASFMCGDRSLVEKQRNEFREERSNGTPMGMESCQENCSQRRLPEGVRQRSGIECANTGCMPIRRIYFSAAPTMHVAQCIMWHCHQACCT